MEIDDIIIRATKQHCAHMRIFVRDIERPEIFDQMKRVEVEAGIQRIALEALAHFPRIIDWGPSTSVYGEPGMQGDLSVVVMDEYAFAGLLRKITTEVRAVDRKEGSDAH